MSTIVYGKPDCPQCTKTKTLLNSYGTEYEYIDITLDDEARESLIDEGFKQMPVVVAPNGEKWSGLNTQKIKKHFKTTVKKTEDDDWDF